MSIDPKRENERELQPDPLLKEGRSSKAWAWIVGIVILAAIVVTFFAVSSNNNTQQAAVPPNQHATRFTTGASNKPPHTAVPAGRKSSSAPKEGTYHAVR